MIMNDMEKYFEKYRSLAEELENCPSVTEQAFLGRLHEVQESASADVHSH